jgi:hypothetical protein
VSAGRSSRLPNSRFGSSCFPAAHSSVAYFLRPQPGDTGKSSEESRDWDSKRDGKRRISPSWTPIFPLLSPHDAIYFKRRTSYLIIPPYGTPLGRFLTSASWALWTGSHRRYSPSSSAGPQCAETASTPQEESHQRINA